MKLFYQESQRYGCYSENWRKSKGQDQHTDVCVVLNPNSYKSMNDGTLSELAPATKSKLYVACTRARGSLFFVPDVFIKKYKLTVQ